MKNNVDDVNTHLHGFFFLFEQLLHLGPHAVQQTGHVVRRADLDLQLAVRVCLVVLQHIVSHITATYNVTYIVLQHTVSHI